MKLLGNVVHTIGCQETQHDFNTRCGWQPSMNSIKNHSDGEADECSYHNHQKKTAGCFRKIKLTRDDCRQSETKYDQRRSVVEKTLPLKNTDQYLRYFNLTHNSCRGDRIRRR